MLIFMGEKKEIKKRKKIAVIVLLTLMLFTIVQITPYHAEIIENKILLTMSSDYYLTPCPDLMVFIQDQLKQINIDVDIIVFNTPPWFYEIKPKYFRLHDLYLVQFDLSELKPDFSNLYSENGSSNLWGYDSSYDFNKSSNRGLNEYYLNQIKEFYLYNRDESLNSCYLWQDYLMDQILPCVPLLEEYDYQVYWDNLFGYNFSRGLLESIGSMSWIGNHVGQKRIDEFCIVGSNLDKLNPLDQVKFYTADLLNGNTEKIHQLIMDPLFYLDSNNQIWPHLVSKYELLNSTHLRLNLRQGIEWQIDPDNLFDNQCFTSKDVYFTYYCWKYLSKNRGDFNWIKNMKIISNYTLDIFIDNNPQTSKNEPNYYVVRDLTKSILPEFYLNQSQLIDGVTPNVEHYSWEVFSKNCFGTGLYKINQQFNGTNLVLELDNSSWWFNETITSDTNLDWQARFGGFENSINYLRFKKYSFFQEAIRDFKLGLLDLINCHEGKILEISENNFCDMSIKIDRKLNGVWNFLVFNLQSENYIGNRDIVSINSIENEIGLTIRKAISFSIDKTIMNKVVFGGRELHAIYPFSSIHGKWCNPKITRYDYDLSKAKQQMELLGFTFNKPGIIIGFSVGEIIVVTVIAISFFITKKHRNNLAIKTRRGNNEY